MKIELRDSLEFLYSDSFVSRRPASSLSIEVARGGTIAAHLLLTGLKKGQALRLKLTGPSAKTVRWFRLWDVMVEENTGLNGFTETTHGVNRFVARRAPFRVFDAMQPIGSSLKAPASTIGLRLHVPVLADDRPGRRQYQITVEAGKEQAELALDVTVYRAVIPPVGAESWPYTNWFSYETIADRHGLTKYSAAWWRMLRRYSDLMVYARQNTFILWQHQVFESGPRGARLNRGRLGRIVDLFTKAGMHWIEGGHFAGRTGGVWESPTFSVTGNGPLVASVEGHAEVASRARQLMDEIRRRRWAGRWLQHAADEPKGQNIPDYRILVGMVHKYMPGIPVIDAVEDTLAIGSPNIWVPKNHDYQNHGEFFDAQRQWGDRIWFYTCCKPGGKWLNRLLDQELLRPALMGWGAALFGLEGFLHWGLNFWQKNQNPFENNVIGWGRKNCLPAGDTHIVYPGEDGPWSSLRLEAQREGVEDLELLRSLKAENPQAARRIIRKAIRGFDDYTTDVRTFRSARKMLLTQAR